MDELALCFDEGYRAYVKSLGKLSNPYPPFSPEHAEFSRGWEQAALQCGLPLLHGGKGHGGKAYGEKAGRP